MKLSRRTRNVKYCTSTTINKYNFGSKIFGEEMCKMMKDTTSNLLFCEYEDSLVIIVVGVIVVVVVRGCKVTVTLACGSNRETT